MARNVAIGIQQFDTLIEKNCFYVDKTDSIREWWESNDSVTLITRPRRFGKTLNMSITEQFFSMDYADCGDLFEGLSIWKEEKYRTLQGTLDLNNPILHLGNVKRKNIRFDIVCREKGEYGEKLETIKKNIILKKVRECVGKREKILAYCPYRVHVDSIYTELSPDETKVIRRYYGKLRKQEKNITEMEYRKGKILALICTKAFGMGVDRSDIQHIVHFAPTGSLSDYVQEIG